MFDLDKFFRASDDLLEFTQDLVEARKIEEDSRNWIDGYAAASPQKSLTQFLAEQREVLNRFESYWNNKRSIDPETFPEEMKDSDWIEQLEFFRDIADKQKS